MITMPEKEDNEEKNKALKTIAKGGSIVFIGLIFSRGFGYLFRIIIARFLGSEAYGLYSLGLATFSILFTISLLGVKSGIRRFISYHRGKREDKVRGVLKSGLKISMPLSIVFSSVLVFFAPQLSIILFNNPEMSLVLRFFGTLIPVMVVVNNLNSVFIGLKKVKYQIYSGNFIHMGLKVALAALFIFLGFELFGVLLAFLLSLLVSLIVSVYYLIYKINYFSFDKSSFSTKKLFLYSWPLVIAAIFMKVIGWTDVLMMGHFLTESQVGIYNAALPTAMILPFFLRAISKIIFPVFSELYGSGDLSDLRRIYQVTTKWIFALTLPFFFVMFFFPKQLLSILFGAEFTPAALSLSILAVAYLYYASLGPLDRILKSIGRTKIYALVMGVSAAVNITFNLLLIPIYGIIGGAIATSVSVILYSTLWLVLLYKELKIIPFTLSYIKVILSGLVSVGIVFFGLGMLFPIPTVSVYIFAFLVFIALYTVFSLLTGVLDSEDTMILKATEKKLGLDLRFAKIIIKKFI